MTLRAAQAEARLVVLDLSEVTFIDANGIHLLVDATVRARDAGCRLVLARPSPIAIKALRHVGAVDQLNWFDAPPAAAGHQTDESLMAQVVLEDDVAFGQLYDRFELRAYRLARSICHNGSCAEDAVQDAFLSVWKSRASYTAQRGGVAAWLLTIVRHMAIDVARGRSGADRRRARADDLDSLPGALDITVNAGARDDQATVRESLARLPAEQLEAISLAFYGELTHTEIAGHLDLPVGTVKSRIRLGLTKLRANPSLPEHL